MTAIQRYESELEVYRAAAREFHKVRDGYRAGIVSDKEFLDARKTFNEACAILDYFEAQIGD